MSFEYQVLVADSVREIKSKLFVSVVQLDDTIGIARYLRNEMKCKFFDLDARVARARESQGANVSKEQVFKTSRL